jgi:hypothetical protein
MKKKKVHILEGSIRTFFFEGKIQWDHAQIPCQNVKNKVFYSSLNTNMHNHIQKKKNPFDLLNETWSSIA